MRGSGVHDNSTVTSLMVVSRRPRVLLPALRELVNDTGAGRCAQAIQRLGYGRPTTPTRCGPLAEVLFVEPERLLNAEQYRREHQP
jgi:hypothetical protein